MPTRLMACRSIVVRKSAFFKLTLAYFSLMYSYPMLASEIDAAWNARQAVIDTRLTYFGSSSQPTFYSYGASELEHVNPGDQEEILEEQRQSFQAYLSSMAYTIETNHP